MKRVTQVAAVAAAGLAVVVSTAGSPTSAASGTSADRSAADPTAGRGPSGWTEISEGRVSTLVEPGLYRTADGVLHIAYGKGGFFPKQLAWSNVSKHGRLQGRGTLLSGWESYGASPELVEGPGNQIRVVFEALNEAAYDGNRLFTATADPAGRDWSLAPAAMTWGESTGNGISAVAVPDQAPIAAFPLDNDVFWRQSDGWTEPTTSDNQVPNGDCCAYDTTLARDSQNGQVMLGWYGNGGSASTRGMFVQQLQPSVGPKIKVPNSSKLKPDQSVALSGRRNAGGVYAAYCVGYPACKKINLWRVGAKKAITVPKSAGAESIAIAPGPQGRMWVVWDKGPYDKIHATLTNRTGTRFGSVRVLKSPANAVYKLSAYSGAVRHLDVVANNGHGLFHRQVLPGLKLTVKPQRFHNNKRHTVTFTVTDAGSPVAGAKIRVAGKTKVTGAKGKTQVVFRKNIKPRRYHASAAKPGYAKGYINVRVLN